MAATVPGLSIESVTTDTASAYSAVLAISGCSYVKLRIRNSNSTLYLDIGNNFSGSQNTDFYSATFSISSSGSTIHIFVSGKIIFIVASTAQVFMVGRLTSIVDGSEIEIYSNGNLTSGTTNRIALSATTNISYSATLLTLSNSQKSALPSSTYFLAETFISPNSIQTLKAPYVNNGHGPYYIAAPDGATLAAGTRLTNGTESFLCTYTSIAWRL